MSKHFSTNKHSLLLPLNSSAIEKHFTLKTTIFINCTQLGIASNINSKLSNSSLSTKTIRLQKILSLYVKIPARLIKHSLMLYSTQFQCYAKTFHSKSTKRVNHRFKNRYMTCPLIKFQ